jgi:hypothetical protein
MLYDRETILLASGNLKENTWKSHYLQYLTLFLFRRKLCYFQQEYISLYILDNIIFFQYY